MNPKEKYRELRKLIESALEVAEKTELKAQELVDTDELDPTLLEVISEAVDQLVSAEVYIADFTD